MKIQVSTNDPKYQALVNDMMTMFDLIDKNLQEQAMKPKWREWFAWRPVKVHGEWVWMKTVYRRCLNTYVDYDDWKRYEYGNIFDVLKDA